MTVRVKYKEGKREYFLQVTGEDIEVDLLTSSGIDIRQIPDEEYSQGFRARERMDEVEEW